MAAGATVRAFARAGPASPRLPKGAILARGRRRERRVHCAERAERAERAEPRRPCARPRRTGRRESRRGMPCAVASAVDAAAESRRTGTLGSGRATGTQTGPAGGINRLGRREAPCRNYAEPRRSQGRRLTRHCGPHRRLVALVAGAVGIEPATHPRRARRGAANRADDFAASLARGAAPS